MAFARAHGKMQVGSFSHKDETTGETRQFKSCAFTDPNDSSKVCFVSFSSNLGELTPQEIAKRKDELQVVQLNTGNYSLCERGNNAWQDVDLGL